MFGDSVVVLTLLLAVAPITSVFAEAEKPLYGGTLIVVMGNDPTSLNYDIYSFDACGAVSSQVYNRLVKFDEKLSITPDLAKSWEMSKDGMAYTFRLVDNATWHDGKPFTSEDVKFTFDFLRANKTAVGYPNLKCIGSIETPDRYTAKFTLKEFSASFLVDLCQNAIIVPRHLYEGGDWATNPYNKKPVGTGPFVFKEWVKDDHVTVDANDRYFRGRPYLDRIIFRIIPDITVATVALEKGEVHVLSTLSRPSFFDLQRLKANPDIKVVQVPGLSYWGLEFNFNHAILSSLKVRKAIAHALDKKKIVNVAYAGVPPVAPNANPFPPAVMWAWNPSCAEYEYDPAKAEKVLDEAGYKKGADGTRFGVTLDFVNYIPGDKEMWLLVKEMLGTVGIRVELRQWGDWGSYFANYMKRNYELNWAWGGGLDPTGFERFFVSYGAYSNGYNNSRVDWLFEQGRKTANIEERAKYYREAQAIMAEELPRIPLWFAIATQVWRSEFRGYVEPSAREYQAEVLPKIWWTKGNPASPVSSREAITKADSEIARLKNEGYDVADALKRIDEAKRALDAGKYAEAMQLAKEALALPKAPPPIGLYAGIVVAVAIVLSGIVIWRRRGRKRTR